MRLAVVILAMAVIAIGLVQIRRSELAARHEIQLLKARDTELRRAVWDQQVRLGYLTAPSEVLRRADEMSLGLTNSPWKVATPLAPRARRN